MAVAQGSCPSCGAHLEFGVGSSIAKVCEYCRATVVRSDRGLENLGKVADLANTPSLVAVGDQGTLAGRPFMVMGRVQLDHGAGPWDEYYVSFDYGQAWGWLAYAQGQWYATTPVAGVALPPLEHLTLERDVPIGQQLFRVAELKTGTIRSAEGELPGAFPAGFTRYYADCYAVQSGFATLDYGDNRGTQALYVGWIFSESQLQIQQAGPRTVQKVKAAHIRCPSCGGEVPKLSGERAERVGCPYCGAVSDIALQQVVAQQERIMQSPTIPIGARGAFDGIEYLCIAQVKRGSDFDDEHFSWEEYLLFSEGIGYRWLVKDESSWMWVLPVNLAELDLTSAHSSVAWGGRTFQIRNANHATVEYVLGEVFWKCAVGETTSVTDYIDGNDVLSREEGPGEVIWSYSTPLAWPVIAQAFGLPVEGPGAQFAASASGAGSGAKGGCLQSGTLITVVLVLLFMCMMGACGACADDDDDGSSTVGSGVFVGGK